LCYKSVAEVSDSLQGYNGQSDSFPRERQLQSILTVARGPAAHTLPLPISECTLICLRLGSSVSAASVYPGRGDESGIVRRPRRGLYSPSLDISRETTPSSAPDDTVGDSIPPGSFVLLVPREDQWSFPPICVPDLPQKWPSLATSGPASYGFLSKPVKIINRVLKQNKRPTERKLIVLKDKISINFDFNSTDMRQLLLFVCANKMIDDYSSVRFFDVSSKIKFAKTISLNYIFAPRISRCYSMC